MSEVLRFGLVGVINTLTSLIIILSLRYGAGMADVPANFIGYVVGICLSFVLNRTFTFKYRGGVIGSFTRFILSAAAAYMSNLVVLLLLLNVLLVPAYLAHPLAMLAYTASMFVLAKTFAFRSRRSAVE